MSKQQGKYTDEEISLIKNTFFENEEGLLALRNHMLQLPVKTDFVKRTGQNPELVALLRKAFLAEPTGDEPNGFVTNIWDQMDLNGKFPEAAFPEIMSTDVIWRYFDQQLRMLAGESVAPVIEWVELRNVHNSHEDSQLLSNQLAYIGILRQVTAQINMFKVFAERKDESPEQLKQRLQKNSTK